MNPVIVMTYITISYRDAFNHIEQRHYPLSKKCRVFVRQIGEKHRMYTFDEQFAAQSEMQEIFADEFYEEGTADDRTSVRVHQPDKRHKIIRTIWRGLVRN